MHTCYKILFAFTSEMVPSVNNINSLQLTFIGLKESTEFHAFETKADRKKMINALGVASIFYKNTGIFRYIWISNKQILVSNS